MSFLPHKKFTWADLGGYIQISPRRYAPGRHMPMKGQGRDPICLGPIISQTAGDTDSVTMEHL